MTLTFSVTIEAEKSEVLAYMKSKNMPEDMLEPTTSVLQLSDFEDANFYDASNSELTNVKD